jgi:hypothetical protein
VRPSPSSGFPRTRTRIGIGIEGAEHRGAARMTMELHGGHQTTPVLLVRVSRGLDVMSG